MIIRRITIAAGVLFVVPAILFAESREEKMARYVKTVETAKDSKERVAAIREISELGQLSANFSKTAVPPLRKVLKDKDAKVRAAAALAVGQIDPEDKKTIVADLIKLLKEDKDESVREGAAQGLGSLGPAAKEAIPALRDAREKATGKRDRIYNMAIQTISGRKKK